MAKDEVMNDVEMEVKDSSETKRTENMNDVDGMEDEKMNDVVGMEKDVTGMKEDVLNVDLLLNLLMANKKAGKEIADKHVLLQIGLTGAGKVSNAFNQ